MGEELRPESAEATLQRLGRVGGWAPGGYHNHCISCQVEFIGDKRAISCLPCAVGALSRPPLPEGEGKRLVEEALGCDKFECQRNPVSTAHLIRRLADHIASSEGDAIASMMEVQQLREELDYAIERYTKAEAIAHPQPANGRSPGVGVSELSFQSRVQPWLLECFGAEIAADELERSDRFLEESLELLQAKGYPRGRVRALEEYVYNRPIGEPSQEVGGVMVTLAALCLAAGLDMHAAGETELARILQPEIVAKIRAKQAAKPTGSALPVSASPPTEGWRPIAEAPRDGRVFVTRWTYPDGFVHYDIHRWMAGDDWWRGNSNAILPDKVYVDKLIEWADLPFALPAPPAGRGEQDLGACTSERSATLQERRPASVEPSAVEAALSQTLQHLYSLEINCGLSSFWDGGWTVWIGDEMNGRHAEALFNREDFDKIDGWLRTEAARLIRRWKRDRTAVKRRGDLAVVAPSSESPPPEETDGEAYGCSDSLHEPKPSPLHKGGE